MAEYTAMLTQGTESLSIGGVVGVTIEDALSSLVTIMDANDWSTFDENKPIMVSLYDDHNDLVFERESLPIEE